MGMKRIGDEQKQEFFTEYVKKKDVFIDLDRLYWQQNKKNLKFEKKFTFFYHLAR